MKKFKKFWLIEKKKNKAKAKAEWEKHHPPQTKFNGVRPELMYPEAFEKGVDMVELQRVIAEREK